MDRALRQVVTELTSTVRNFIVDEAQFRTGLNVDRSLDLGQVNDLSSLDIFDCKLGLIIDLKQGLIRVEIQEVELIVSACILERLLEQSRS